MENPTHTAEWLYNQVLELRRADQEPDQGSLALLLHVLAEFDRAFDDELADWAYAREKILQAQIGLRRAAGIDPSDGRPPMTCLEHASTALHTLQGLDFQRRP